MDVCYDSINLTPEIKFLLISGTSTICWQWETKPILAIKTFVILRRNHKKWNTLCVVIIAYIGLSCRMDRLLFKMNEFWELLKELIHPKLWAFYCFQAKAGRFSDAKEEFCKLGQENLKPFFSFFFFSFCCCCFWSWEQRKFSSFRLFEVYIWADHLALNMTTYRNA